MSRPRRVVGKSAHNERRKLFATSLNTIGLAVFGLGVLTPAFGTGEQTSLFRFVGATAILWLFHSVAQSILKRLED
jgi:hypothetical protein